MRDSLERGSALGGKSCQVSNIDVVRISRGNREVSLVVFMGPQLLMKTWRQP
jgi:hypothetical protein